MYLNRRRFIEICGLTSLNIFGLFSAFPGREYLKGAENYHDSENLHEAKFYKRLKDDRIQCELCPNECIVDDIERGTCGVRENRGGKYYDLVHSRPCAVHLDPVEKKPFFHFYPSTLAFSIATAGCNIECKYCQNWNISQSRPEQIRSFYLPPEEVVKKAKELKATSIAFTYTEPVIFYEYMYDIARIAHKSGIKTGMISNGYINEKPMSDLLPFLDGVKIDLKSFNEKFYKDICRGELKPVLDTLIMIKRRNRWLEIVYLMIPTLNDKKEEIEKMCEWIFNHLGPDVPLHFTRFHPVYRLKNLPPTPVSSLEAAKEAGIKKGLHYVYIGNVPGHNGENTYCPFCNKM
ncbi:MAG: AmmeMemoRadiSam system radical SAM enzyme, partial [Thermodesulfobacteriota bacterium]|nr:AmmeMemoRadiSam system radical SAM enzyme [Thermodesulfobacteriota bacterium]